MRKRERERSPAGAAADPPAAGAAELETATAPPDGTLASLLKPVKKKDKNITYTYETLATLLDEMDDKSHL